MLAKAYAESELILGLIGATGTDLARVRRLLEERLKVIGYKVVHVKITRDVIPQIVKSNAVEGEGEFERTMRLMDDGNQARQRSKDSSILALGAAAFINATRKKKDKVFLPSSKTAFIISSLKHPDEVNRLRAVYPHGFFLIGVYSDLESRLNFLEHDKRIAKENARRLVERDEDENLDYGQRVLDTFHLSDFFLPIEGDEIHLKESIWRILDLLFGNPYVTPTFDEFAMFLAFAASLSSADLSRQVGAVVAMEDEVVATGANDCPRAFGGRYWPKLNEGTHRIEDVEEGRDYKRGEDSNKIEKQRMIEDIIEKAAKVGLDKDKLRGVLETSRIDDLTEFGRVVHAEMNALLSCARLGASTQGGTLYSTTFPCHNCAKHIIASGISRVVFIEPYQKSKASEFHKDSVTVRSKEPDPSRVRFEPFIGVGPRRFFDLFSVRHGSGYTLKRKDETGKTLEWKPEGGILRLQMLPASYLDLEAIADRMFNEAREGDDHDGDA